MAYDLHKFLVLVDALITEKISTIKHETVKMNDRDYGP